MQIQFAKYSPTGNTTILVETPIPRQQHGRLADRLMAPEHIGAEQVGYIEPATLKGAWARLQMMGGEFCGNASMSLAAHLAMQSNIHRDTTIPIEVSGAVGIVQVAVHPGDSGYICRVDMPLPEEVCVRSFDLDGEKAELPYVRFPGISFAIPEWKMPDEKAACLAAQWNEAVGSDAFGIIHYDAKNNAIRPLVYVRETNSAVWEHGCGSGTSALGAWLAYKADGDVQKDIAQPGGVIQVYARMRNHRIVRLQIEGKVTPICRGTAWLT